MSTYNNFELLMYAAAEKSCDQMADEFLNVDGTGFEITPSQQKRMNRIAKGYISGGKRKTIATKWIAVACIISVVIGLTACVSIPKIRNAIKAFFVEWYEDYIAIGFGDNDGSQPKYEFIEPNVDTTEANMTEANNSANKDSAEESIVYPTTIEKKATLTYLPGEYDMVVDFDDETYYLVSFYDDEEFILCFSQKIITSELKWTNSENQKIYKTIISNHDAILVEDSKTPNIYTLIWQDTEYEYLISGRFSDKSEIIKIAESLVLQ